MALVFHDSSLGTLCGDDSFEQATGVRFRILGCGPATVPGGSLASAPAFPELFDSCQLLLLSQVHGCTVREAHDWDDSQRQLPEGDAWLVRVGEMRGAFRAYGLKTADCLPLILVAGEWAALVHAGWRGLAAGIVQQVVRQIASHSHAHELHLLIGPHALQSSYEVGKKVLEAFTCQGVRPVYSASSRPERYYFSLQDTLIGMVDDCSPIPVRWYPTTSDTITDLRFHSHRRDGSAAGRNVTWIW